MKGVGVSSAFKFSMNKECNSSFLAGGQRNDSDPQAGKERRGTARFSRCAYVGIMHMLSSFQDRDFNPGSDSFHRRKRRGNQPLLYMGEHVHLRGLGLLLPSFIFKVSFHEVLKWPHSPVLTQLRKFAKCLYNSMVRSTGILYDNRAKESHIRAKSS